MQGTLHRGFEKTGKIVTDGQASVFDNLSYVGGSVLEVVIDHMADFGVWCLSGYSDAQTTPRPAQYVSTDHPPHSYAGIYRHGPFADVVQFREEFGAWVNPGKFLWCEDIQEGFDNNPATLQRLFAGRNQGKQLLKLDDPQ